MKKDILPLTAGVETMIDHIISKPMEAANELPVDAAFDSKSFDTNSQSTCNDSEEIRLDDEDVKTEYFKYQDRRKKNRFQPFSLPDKAAQGVKNGQFELTLIFPNRLKGIFDHLDSNLRQIQVFIKRKEDIPHRNIGFAEIQPLEVNKDCDHLKIHLKSDLDFVRVKNGQMVYHLEKTNMDKFNVFYLKVEIALAGEIDFSTQFDTRSFRIIGKEKKPVRNPRKRRDTDLESIVSTTYNPSEHLQPLLGTPRSLIGSDSGKQLDKELLCQHLANINQQPKMSYNIDYAPNNIPPSISPNSISLSSANVGHSLSGSSHMTFTEMMNSPFLQQNENHTNIFEMQMLSSNVDSSPTNSSNMYDEIRTQTLVAKHIEAQSIKLGATELGDIIRTLKGDVAYNYLKRYAQQKFIEGEVVGIFKSDNNGTVIDKLSFANSDSTFLVGVITRSQFLEAQAPKTTEAHLYEQICMLGSVPVKSTGPCCHGDAMYISPDIDGVATARRNLKREQVESPNCALVGFANFGTENEMNGQVKPKVYMVQCFVSVLQSAGQTLMSRQLRENQIQIETKIKRGNRKQRRSTKCTLAIVSCLILALVLLGALCWQLFFPGSAYRYWRCTQGGNQYDTASFFYIPYSDQSQYHKSKGIRFEYRKLLGKTEQDYFPPLSGKGFRYYLNLNRCAAGLRRAEDRFLNLKEVWGPQFFAINKNCSKVYFATSKGQWKKYKTAKPEFICCTKQH